MKTFHSDGFSLEWAVFKNANIRRANIFILTCGNQILSRQTAPVIFVGRCPDRVDAQSYPANILDL